MSRSINYLRADMDRAVNMGQQELTVLIIDLREVMAALDSMLAKEAVKFHGQHLGWVCLEKVKEMNQGKRFYLTLRRKKHPDFCLEVFTAPLHVVEEEPTNTPE